MIFCSFTTEVLMSWGFHYPIPNTIKKKRKCIYCVLEKHSPNINILLMTNKQTVSPPKFIKKIIVVAAGGFI